jgi:hypothetical protein
MLRSRFLKNLVAALHEFPLGARQIQIIALG